MPGTADSWLDLRTYMSVRDGSGKKNQAVGKDMGWLLCLSFASGCSSRTQGGLQRLGADFQSPHSLPDNHTGHSFHM